MKRFLFILFIIICCSTSVSYAEDWSDYSNAGNLWGEQKSITNDEFEKAIQTLEANKQKKETKQKKKKVKKLSGGGTSLHPGLDPMSEIQMQDPLTQKDDEGQLLNVPVKLYLEDKFIETGYYNIYGEKEKNGDIYLSFYQAHKLIGKVKAIPTNDDFNSDSINFVKLIPYNNDYVQIGFGSLDFNACVYIRYEQP